ncbi:MAG: hypothetical protein RLZZ165_1662, partial [Bacteroidota bacterium]
SFGIGMVVKFGNIQAILVDGLRGGLTMFLAYLAGKALQQR